MWAGLVHATDSEVRFADAVAAERALAFEAAVAACNEVVALDPQGVRAPSCRRRIAAWEARRDRDGQFTGWAALSRVRRTHRQRGPAAGRADLEALIDARPLSPAVEAEVGIWLARDALDRLGDPRLALENVARGLAHEATHEGALANQLLSVRALALAASGSERAALETEALARGDVRQRSPVERRIRDRWRRRLTWAAGGIFAAAVLAGFPLAVAGWWRARPAPWGLLPIGVAATGAWLIAEGWSAGAGAAALVGGALFTCVHLLVLGVHAWLREGRRARYLPWVRVGAVVATAAAFWLAIASTESFPWMGW